VFEAVFEKGGSISKSWTLKKDPNAVPKIIQSPKGDRSYLGPMPCGEQRLTLKNLPKHTHIRISFDLILVGSWDGNSTLWGPDTWKLSLDQRVPVIFSDFSNVEGAGRQSFPDNVGGSYKANPAWYGAAEKNTLGYKWESSPGHFRGADAVYHFNIILPHRAAQAVLKFNSNCIDNNKGKMSFDSYQSQWYGLDSVKVFTLNQGRELGEKKIQAAFDDLVCDNVVRRYQARMALLASDIGTTNWIEAALKVISKKQLAQLIMDLEAEEFETRKKATRLLSQLPDTYEEALRKAFTDSKEPEAADRLRAVLQEIKGKEREAAANAYKLLLKLIDTPKARELLKSHH